MDAPSQAKLTDGVRSTLTRVSKIPMGIDSVAEETGFFIEESCRIISTYAQAQMVEALASCAGHICIEQSAANAFAPETLSDIDRTKLRAGLLRCPQRISGELAINDSDRQPLEILGPAGKVPLQLQAP